MSVVKCETKKAQRVASLEISIRRVLLWRRYSLQIIQQRKKKKKKGLYRKTDFSTFHLTRAEIIGVSQAKFLSFQCGVRYAVVSM